MKFTAHVNDLRNALQIVNMALQAKTTNPILECVLLKAEDDKLTLTGTDSLMQVAFTVPCEVQVPGSSAVRGKLLEEVVRRMEAGEVEIAVDDRNGFAVKCGRAKSKIAGSAADEFPLKPEIGKASKITIPAVEFYNMIAGVERCIAKDDMRAVLTGGCIDVKGGNISMVGLDGFRLAVKEMALSSIPNDCRVIIPGKSLGVIKKLLASAGEELIDLNFTDTEFEMQFASANVKCTLIEGEYVNWRGIVPQTFKTLCTVDAQQFAGAVERAALMARLGSNNLIRLSIAEDSVTVYATSGIDDMQETIDAEVNGEPLDIAFNVVYLSDAMKMFDNGTIILHLNSSITPCVVCTTTAVSDFFWLILPVRTSA